MPWKIVKAGPKFKVVSASGRVAGTHSTKADATNQLQALYAAKARGEIK